MSDGPAETDWNESLEPGPDEYDDPTGGSSQTQEQVTDTRTSEPAPLVMTTDRDEHGRTYLERRQTNKDERKSLTIYLAEGRRADVDELKAKARRHFPGENITDLDLYEAIWIAGAENPDAVLQKLREMGYGN